MDIFNPNLLKGRDSYLDTSLNGTKIILDVTKGVFPLLTLEQLQEYNQRTVEYVLDNFGYEYMDLSENGEYHKFKETISRKFSEFGIKPNNIILGHGSFHIVERVFTKALNSGRKILGVGPQFNELPDEFKRIPGNSYETVFESGSLDYSPRLEMLLDKLNSEDKVSCIYLDNPNNPTGKALDKELVEEIIILAEQKGGILVLMDEAYGDFLTDEQSGVSFINSYSNVLVVKSMSKAYGLSRDRIGYAMGNEELVRLINPIFVPFEPGEKSVILGNIVMDENPQLDISVVAKRKQDFIDAISDTDIQISQTNLTVPIITLARKGIYELLARNGIKSVSGKSYNQTHQEMSDNECRIVLPLDQEKQRFIEGVLINN